MMGGENKHFAEGFNEKALYFITDKLVIESSYHCNINYDDYTKFTIDEFENKFPFKIGDSVIYNTFGEICSVGEIMHMDWNEIDNMILYMTTNGHVVPANALKFNHSESGNASLYITKEDETGCEKTNFVHYDELQFPESVEDFSATTESCDIENFIADVIDFTNNIVYDDKVKLELGDTHEVIVDENGDTYVIRKGKVLEYNYPKTYEECCKEACYSHYYPIVATHTLEYDCKLCSLYKLIVCRNVYWKYADFWEPSEERNYIISRDRYGVICLSKHYGVNSILAFPTEEMRDIFYENFKELIEECKDLL
jgi:hypothetical protein